MSEDEHWVTINGEHVLIGGDSPILKETVGFRYGAAPESGKSYNQREKISEKGVSMASVAGLPENRGMTTAYYREQKRKKYYYKGTIIDTGSDDEPIFANIKSISKEEYHKSIKSAHASFVREDLLVKAQRSAEESYNHYSRKVYNFDTGKYEQRGGELSKKKAQLLKKMIQKERINRAKHKSNNK